MFKLLVLYISLLTCPQGKELYAHYGHTALRVVDTEQHVDLVFNYGIFDFNTDDFYGKFVKGETYYQLGVQSFSSFSKQYRDEGRPVFEQVLNLNEAQARKMFKALLVNYEPKNRFYLYNFVFDNCATRPYELIKHIMGDSIQSTYVGWEGKTYREFLNHYTGQYSIWDYLINMIFGKRSDVVMHGEDRLFLPEELMFYLSEATLPDGTPIVKEQTIDSFHVPPTPWYKTWFFILGLWLAALIALTWWDKKRHRFSWWVDAIAAIVYLFSFVVSIYLTFFSIHPMVGFNIRLLIIPILHLCIRLFYIRRFSRSPYIPKYLRHLD